MIGSLDLCPLLSMIFIAECGDPPIFFSFLPVEMLPCYLDEALIGRLILHPTSSVVVVIGANMRAGVCNPIELLW
jgi:hypothetical protein